MVSHWSLSNTKSPQVSRTLLSIQADLNSALVWMVSTRPLIYKSSSHYTNPLVTSKTTNHNWYHNHFHVPQFFQFSRKVQVLIFFSLSFSFTPWSAGQQNPLFRKFSFFLFFSFLFFFFFFVIITRSGRLTEIRCSIGISKSQRSLCVSFSKTDSGFCIYHLFVWQFSISCTVPVDHLVYPIVSSLILLLLLLFGYIFCSRYSNGEYKF